MSLTRIKGDSLSVILSRVGGDTARNNARMCRNLVNKFDSVHIRGPRVLQCHGVQQLIPGFQIPPVQIGHAFAGQGLCDSAHFDIRGLISGLKKIVVRGFGSVILAITVRVIP